MNPTPKGENTLDIDAKKTKKELFDGTENESIQAPESGVDALHDREGQYQSIFEYLEEGYFEVDLKGKYTFVNIALCKNYGASRDDLIGLNYKVYMDKQTAEKVYRVFNHVYKTGIPCKLLEWEITKKDGTKAAEESSVYLITNSKGDGVGFRGIVRDITERKEMQETLRQSEERYRTILDSIDYGYFEVDLTGSFVCFNDSLCQQLGYSKDELTGMSYRDYMDKETIKKIYQVFNQVYATGEPLKVYNWTIIQKNGTKRIHEVSVSLIRNAKGERIGFRGINRDVTERKILEEEREKSIQDLQEALAKVKMLSGFLPICAYCKKIRNDEGYWTQIEAYIHDHSEAEFSHGICPGCKEKLYGNFFDKEANSRMK
jgi:PAS domain S-box-containing protein